MVDIKRLKELYDENDCAKLFFDYAVTRKKNASQTTVDRLMAVLLTDNENGSLNGNDHLNRRELIELLKQLELIGCGEFVVGRHGKASRFNWSVSIVEVGQAARGEVSAVRAAIRPSPDDPSPATVENCGSDADVIIHTYQLRSDLQVSLRLPPNLTTKEAGRLADFVRTLPFETEVTGGSQFEHKQTSSDS